MFCILFLLPCFFFFFLCLPSGSGWGWGGRGPASEPVLAWIQPQALHLPLNHSYCPPPVANAAWCQETGVCSVHEEQIETKDSSIWTSVKLNWLFTIGFPCLSVIKEVLPHHLPGCHRLDCCLLVPNGVVGSPGRTISQDIVKITECYVILPAVQQL